MKTRTKIFAGLLMTAAAGAVSLPAIADNGGRPGKTAEWQPGDSRAKPVHYRAGRPDRDHGPRGMRGPGGPGGGMKAMIERFDVNQDGVITKDEVISVSTERLKAFDKDGDGMLSLDEWTALWTDTMKQQIVRAFQERDPDGDAKVTLDEYTKPFDRMFARMDRDKDGKIDAQDTTRPGRDRDGPRGPGMGPGGMGPGGAGPGAPPAR